MKDEALCEGRCEEALRDGLVEMWMPLRFKVRLCKGKQGNILTKMFSKLGLCKGKQGNILTNKTSDFQHKFEKYNIIWKKINLNTVSNFLFL